MPNPLPPVWMQWPHLQRRERRSKRPRRQVRGGRWYVMKAPAHRQYKGKRWAAINFTRKQYRYFHTWQEAWDYAVIRTRQVYLDARAKRR